MHGRGRFVALCYALYFAALVWVLVFCHHQHCRVPAIGPVCMVAAHGKRVLLFAGHDLSAAWEVSVADREHIYTYTGRSISIKSTGFGKHTQVPARKASMTLYNACVLGVPHAYRIALFLCHFCLLVFSMVGGFEQCTRLCAHATCVHI